MQLTDQDKAVLLRWGHPVSDLPQLQAACNEVHLTLSNGYGEQAITARNAVRVLGREQFLSGISRAAFHCTATRVSPQGLGVHFSLRHWWK